MLLYERFAELREKRAHLLQPGERWLTPWDDVEEDDVYLIEGLGGTAPSDWVHFSSTRHKFRPLPMEYFCYTPKGRRGAAPPPDPQPGRRFDLST